MATGGGLAACSPFFFFPSFGGCGGCKEGGFPCQRGFRGWGPAPSRNDRAVGAARGAWRIVVGDASS
eukprot:11914904-Prorocentrum_lima.AAC.1